MPRAIAVTDLPIPESRSLDAIADYRAALQATRDAAGQTAIASLRGAVKADPTMAAAWWRLADLLAGYGELDKAREAYAKAMQLRGSLTERDRACLFADEPAIAWPTPNAHEARHRYEALLERYPRDAEIQATVAFLAHASADNTIARVALEHAIALDPQYATAWMVRGWVAQAEDDESDARAAYARCQEIAPTATNCMTRLATIQGARGECEEMAKAAEKMTAVAPDEPVGPKFAAFALAARDGSNEVLRERVSRWVEHVDSPLEKSVILANLELWRGDFHAAAARAGEISMDREVGARIRAELLAESGRLVEGGREASRFLKSGAWTQGVNDALRLDDAMPTLMAIARRAGTLTPARWSDVSAT